MKAAVLGVALVVLSGCFADPKTLAEEDHQSCVGYGFQPGSEIYGQCRMKLDVERRNDRARRQQNVAASLQRTSDGYFRAARQTRPVTCRTVGFNTTCY